MLSIDLDESRISTGIIAATHFAFEHFVAAGGCLLAQSDCARNAFRVSDIHHYANNLSGCPIYYASSRISWCKIECDIGINRVCPGPQYSAIGVGFYRLAQRITNRNNLVAVAKGGVYRSGDSLAVSILQVAAKPVSSWHFRSGVQDLEFFHYTNSPEVGNLVRADIIDRTEAQGAILRDGGYEEIFRFIRTRDAARPMNLSGRVLYLAEDPKSSDIFGKHRLHLFFSPDAKVLRWDDSTWDQAWKEISIKFPEIKEHCDKVTGDYVSLATDLSVSRSIRGRGIYFLMAEDSGISLIDYLDGAWFYMISPDAVTKSAFESE